MFDFSDKMLLQSQWLILSTVKEDLRIINAKDPILGDASTAEKL